MRSSLSHLEHERPSGLYLIELRAHFARANALKRHLIDTVCDSLPTIPFPIRPPAFVLGDKPELSDALIEPACPQS